jgi:predicted NAD/FAD-binding protein
VRIAVVGAGISGLLAAYILGREHDVTLFEADERPGGHANTIDVTEPDGTVRAVDTGFIVFNDRTYPTFIRLLDQLGVAWQPADMSFSVSCAARGLEYNGTSLDALFAQRRNLLSPRFLRMVRDILRFHREAPRILELPESGLTLGQMLEAGGYSAGFVEDYIVPMGAAIWSARPETMFGFPARFFVRFFANHGLLSVDDRPVWRTVTGGSRRYVEALLTRFTGRVLTGTPVAHVERHVTHALVTPRGAEPLRFDELVLACHADQALALLADADPVERAILSAFPYPENIAVLHTDPSLMPHRPKVWASWNYLRRTGGEPTGGGLVLTYWMNRLQSLPGPRNHFVTLNAGEATDPKEVIRRIVYHHPLYTPASIDAQARWEEINGVRRTSFCGAYWGHGFHEDGARSALAVTERFGLTL